MQKHNIKYEALSSEIKKEIELFYTGLRKHNDGLSLEEAMSSWFEKEFDLWMVRNYPAGPKDRRMAERRKSVRIEPGKKRRGQERPEIGSPPEEVQDRHRGPCQDRRDAHRVVLR